MGDVRGVLLRTPVWVVILVGVLAGLGVGLLASAAQPTLYRAKGTLVVERGTQPLVGSAGDEALVRTFRALGNSDAVAESLIANLALPGSAKTFHDRVKVTTDGSAVLYVRADAPTEARAIQIVQQLGLELTKLVHDRFGQVTLGGREPLQIAVFDAPHALSDRVSPQTRRMLGWGALLGLVAGLLGANILASRRPPSLTIDQPPLLGEVGSEGGFDAVAGRLLEIARQEPFQTVVLVGDADAKVATGIAGALTERGQLTAVARAGEPGTRLEGLAARHAFVLVGAGALDPELAASADVVVAVTDGDSPGLDLLLGLYGVRLVGAVVA